MPRDGLIKRIVRYSNGGYFRNDKQEKADAKEALEEEKIKEAEELEELKKERAESEKELKDILDNWPVYKKDTVLIGNLEKKLKLSEKDLDKAYKELKSGNDKALKQLADIYTEQKIEGSKALGEYRATIGKSSADLTRGEEEARVGLGKSLDIYRKQAKRDYLPGQEVIQDQLKETTASGLSAIKRYSGGKSGLSGLIDLYRNQQVQEANLGVTAAQNKQNMEMNLAGAEANAGTTMSDIIRSNASTNAQMGSSLYSAYSDYLNKIAAAGTNVATNTLNTGLNEFSAASNINAVKNANAGTMYNVNATENMNEYNSRLAPAQIAANFASNKYFESNPTGYQFDIYGRNIGMAYADIQSAQNKIDANNATAIKLMTEAVKTGLNFVTGGQGLGFIGANSMAPTPMPK